MYLIRRVAVVIALGSTFLRCTAQVTTSCNPLDGICPNDMGLASNFYYIDFTTTKTLPSEWTAAQNTIVNLGPSGAELTFNKRFDAPTVRTNFNFFFGRVEYVVKAAPGTGIISSMVLLSDDLDEVDWEFRGGITDSVQTNYFGKGYTGTYNRSTTNAVTTPQASFHTYAIDWSPDSLVWSIDGKNVRTLGAADAGFQFPQTPMKVPLSLWDGGDPQGNPGTIQWAGGLTPLPVPETYSMFIKSVKIWNAKPAQQYKYSDNSGSWQSIKLINDTMMSNVSTPAQTPAIMSSAPMSSFESHPVDNTTAKTSSSCTIHSSPLSAMPVRMTTAQSFSNKTFSVTSSCSSTHPVSSGLLVHTMMAQPYGNSTLSPTSSCSSTGLVSSAMLAHTTTTQSSEIAASSACPSSSVRCINLSNAASPSMIPGTQSHTSPPTVGPSTSSTAIPSSLMTNPMVSTIYPDSPASPSAVNPSGILTDSYSATTSPPLTTTSTCSTCSTPSSSTPQPSPSAASSSSVTSPSPSAAASSPMVSPNSSITDTFNSAAASSTMVSPNSSITDTFNSAAASSTMVSPESSTSSTSSSASTGDFTSLADGDSVIGVLLSSTDTTKNSSITQTVFQTQTLTSVTSSLSTTTIPYPILNGSTVAAIGSVASTGASVSASGSGYAKATSAPIIYSNSGSEMRGNRATALVAVIAGTMAAMGSVL